MGTFAAILASLPQLLKLASFFVSLIEKTPQESRREALEKFDKALAKAEKDNDLSDLSKWLGKRL